MFHNFKISIYIWDIIFFINITLSFLDSTFYKASPRRIFLFFIYYFILLSCFILSEPFIISKIDLMISSFSSEN